MTEKYEPCRLELTYADASLVKYALHLLKKKFPGSNEIAVDAQLVIDQINNLDWED
jgi:hypothetical protein